MNKNFYNKCVGSYLVGIFMEIQSQSVALNNNTDLKSANLKSVTNSIAPVSKEYMDSKASMAARAYASPQINFQGKYDKMLNELNSSKVSNKIKISYDEAVNFLEKLGFSSRGGKGSHCNFVKEGTIPITIPRPHAGHNTITPYCVDDIRDFLKKNNITKL